MYMYDITAQSLHMTLPAYLLHHLPHVAAYLQRVAGLVYLLNLERFTWVGVRSVCKVYLMYLCVCTTVQWSNGRNPPKLKTSRALITLPRPHICSPPSKKLPLISFFFHFLTFNIRSLATRQPSASDQLLFPLSLFFLSSLPIIFLLFFRLFVHFYWCPSL
ncbi:hypothetical protein F4810DRAFT_181078 [Camillea tinctor]|nr:hypothetical protein F4810DRAFT_181078 [Camillea tinctor]